MFQTRPRLRRERPPSRKAMPAAVFRIWLAWRPEAVKSFPLRPSRPFTQSVCDRNRAEAKSGMITYFVIDILTFLSYLYFSIPHPMVTVNMRIRKQKTTPCAESERLLQAKLPADLVKALRILALEREMTVKQLLTQLVQEYLERERALDRRAR